MVVLGRRLSAFRGPAQVLQSLRLALWQDVAVRIRLAECVQPEFEPFVRGPQQPLLALHRVRLDLPIPTVAR